MNTSLRSHVTRTGFSLDLGKLHIFWLVAHYLSEEEKTHYRPWWTQSFPGNVPDEWRWYAQQGVKGYQGLSARGLLRTVPDGGTSVSGRPTYRTEITEAGSAAVVLLWESGIFQEYAKALVPIPKSKRKAVA